jgi:hypothetical protein
MRIWFSKIILISLVMFVLLAPACSQAPSALNGSGKIIEQDVKLTDFDSLEVQGAFNLEITQADSFKVTLITDGNLVSRILFSQSGKTLKISIEAPASFFPTSLKLRIAMPKIVGLNLSKAAKASLDGFKSTSNFNLVLKNASFLSGNLEANVTNFFLADASQVILQGKATSLELDSAGASKLDLGEFVLATADVELREASIAVLNVNGEFDVVLKDASRIYYLGNPLIRNTSITGDSSMIHK